MKTNIPNKEVRFGVIGTSGIAEKVLNAALEDPRFVLNAVYSRNRETGQTFAAKFKVNHVFTSIEEMVSSNLIDAVYIASPNSLHAEQSILCMNHGKHVLCEKPLASNAREVKAMIDSSKANNVTLMEAMMPTLTPNFIAMRNHVDKLGKIRNYFSSFCQYSSRYDQLKDGVVLNAFDLSLSNGAVMDLGVYCIYPMVLLFGKPKSLSALGIKLNTGVDGQGTVHFDYGEMNATIIYSKIASSILPTEIHGEEALVSMDRVSVINKVIYKKQYEDPILISKRFDHNMYYYEIEEFINLVNKGELESKVNSHQNSLITIEIIDEIRKQIGVKYPADIEVESK